MRSVTHAIDSGGTRLALLLVLAAGLASAQPLRVPWAFESTSIPSNQAGDTALLPDPLRRDGDLLFGADQVNNGLYGFLPRDGGTGFFGPFGAVGGVDAVRSLSGLPDSTRGGLVVASGITAGSLFAFGAVPDGGFESVLATNVLVASPGALTLADFGATPWLFTESGGSSVQPWALSEDGGRLVMTREALIPLVARPVALASSRSLRRVYASVGAFGVVEIDPLGTPPAVTQIIDAGLSPLEVVEGLAVYPQRDGGALLLTAVSPRSLVRVYRLQRGREADLLAELEIVSADGGNLVRQARAIDVWPGSFGRGFDGGVLAIGDRLRNGGANFKLVSWPDLARAVTPPLPIDDPDLEPVVIAPTGPTPIGVGLRLETGAAGTGLALSLGLDAVLVGLRGVRAFFLEGPDAGRVDGGVDAGSGDAGQTDAGPGLPGTVLAAPDGGVLDLQVSTLLPELRAVAPGGVVSVASAVADAGLLLAFSVVDGGLEPLLSLPFQGVANAVAIGDFGDGGAWAFVASERTVRRFRIERLDGGLVASAAASLATPAAVTSLLPVPGARRLLLAAGPEGVLEVDPLVPNPTSRQLVDAGDGTGAAFSLGLYPQRDGGAVLLTSHPRLAVFRAWQLGVTAQLLAEFAPRRADGGTLALQWLAVSAGPLGRNDAGVRYPGGALALLDDAGTVSVFDWRELASAVAPPLPVELPPFVDAGADGGRPDAGPGPTGGGRTGGGRAGGAGGGGDEPPPPGCCTGAPSDVIVPIVFLAWVWRFQRRRRARGPADSPARP